jgi:hypothetical protein
LAILYAARDGEAGLKIFDEIKDLPDLLIRLQKEELEVDMSKNNRKTIVDAKIRQIICALARSRNG